MKCEQMKRYDEAMKDNPTMKGYVKPADRPKKKVKKKLNRVSLTDTELSFVKDALEDYKDLGTVEDGYASDDLVAIRAKFDKA